MNRNTLSATTIIGDKVRNPAGETLGKIEDLMIDVRTGNVAYAVLSHGGVLGIGDKLFAVPWRSMTIDFDSHEVLVNVSKEALDAAPGFDKDNWPDFSDPTYTRSIDSYFGSAMM